MKKLTECTWREFLLEDIAYFNTGANLPKKKLHKGSIPRITATDKNNGVESFTCEVEDNSFRIFRNAISISFLGSCFYQQYSASYDMKIHNFTLKSRELNKYVGLFIASQCKKFCEHINYGNQLSSTDLPKQKLLLPILEDGTPDYEFMEEYMRQKEQLLLEQIEHKLFQDIKDLEKVLPPTCQPKEWKSFEVKQIFSSIQRGKRLKNDDHIEGSVPYVSSSSVNNGVDDFIGNEKKVRRFSDCLTIANSGSVGSTFYHPYEFVASDHVTQLKQPRANKYVYLYLSQMVSRISEKYSFNREINDSRINNEMVMLPVNADGEPDYEYMEQKMRYIEAKMLLNYFRSKFK